MPANPNWARWLFASTAAYLKQIAAQENVAALVEGLDIRTDALMSATDLAEIRFTGPFSRELSHNYYELKFDINVLISSRYGSQEKNRYEFTRIAGIFHEALDSVIAVYKCGNMPGDDANALVGCLSPLSGRNDAVRVFHFGQNNPTDGLRQSMVDARYRMEINDTE